MKARLTCGLLALMLSNHVAYAANDDLKAELDKLQKELADLTGKIDAKSWPEFKVARDIELKGSTGRAGLGFPHKQAQLHCNCRRDEGRGRPFLSGGRV